MIGWLFFLCFFSIFDHSALLLFLILILLLSLFFFLLLRLLLLLYYIFKLINFRARVKFLATVVRGTPTFSVPAPLLSLIG